MPNAIVKGEVSKATPSFVFPSGKVIVMGFFSGAGCAAVGPRRHPTLTLYEP